MKRLVIFAGIAGFIIIFGFGWFYAHSRGTLISPKRGVIEEAVYGLGTVIAPKTFQLKVGVNLSIRKVFVKEGDLVEKNAPLVSFDDSATARAPFAGTITSVPYREGEVVFPQFPILTLVDLSQLFMEVSLEQQAALRIREKQKALVTFESLIGQKFEGVVKAVFPRDNQFIVRIDLEHFPAGILPAMTADVAIEVGKKENALMIPVRAIVGGKVTVVRDGAKKKMDVQLGVVNNEWAEVISGDIQLTDQVLIRK